MLKEDIDEIISILKKQNKKDLITKLRIYFDELLDEDYVPIKIKSGYLSDSEGSAVSEDEYAVCEDDGLFSLG